MSNILNLTKEQIAKLFELTDEVKKYEDLASEMLRTVQDQNGSNEHGIERNGKTVKLTEAVLWKEIFHLGKGSQAWIFMERIYPEVFEAFSKQEKKAEELKVYGIQNFGVDYTKLRLADFVLLMDAMVRFRMANPAEEEPTSV